MEKGVLSSAIAFTLLVGFVSCGNVYLSFLGGTGRRSLLGNGSEICSWQFPTMVWTNRCGRDKFQCINGNCITRSYYCDGGDDCGDSSDELYCNTDSCPENPTFIRCRGTSKCIPQYYICDGIKDCSYGDDESDCDDKIEMTPTQNIRYWIESQRKSQSSAGMWGAQVDKYAVSLYYLENNFTHPNNEAKRILAYETSIQFLSWLTTRKLHDIPSTELASFINAFLVTCVDPRKFHGIDIIQELRTRVNRQNYTNPYVLLSLCNAGDTITEEDKEKLFNTFWDKQRPFWTDMQAYVVMALACASKQPGNDAILKSLKGLTLELKQQQYRNGSIENLQTTALVMQALIAAESKRDPDNFDEKKAIEAIRRHQETDGSFGDLLNTYFVIPVLYCKSFADINSDHCEFVQADEISAQENLAKRGGDNIHVRYSLLIGNEKDTQWNLALKVPVNMSFYGIMELAAEIDSRYRFEYKVKDRKPYITGISGFRDNPEKGKFWFLYEFKDGKGSPSQNSPVDVIPKENDHYVMWYRSGSWVD